MNARARNFIAANELSPVVYGSVDGNCVTYRLADGKIFRLTTAEAQWAPNPRWAFRALFQHRNEEAALLAKVEAESRQPDPGRWER